MSHQISGKCGKCLNVSDTNNVCEKIMMLKFPEMIRKIHQFPISANKPTYLTDIKPPAD